MAISLNIFNKFLHQDTEKTFQPEGTYYDMLNKRIIQKDDGNFSVKSMDGTETNFGLPKDGFVIIGSTSNRRNKIYVVAVDITGNGDTEIGEFTLTVNSNSKAMTATYLPLYHSSSTGSVVNDSLNFSTSNPISRIAIEYIEESDTVGNIYISDNNNPPIVINVLDPLYKFYSISIIANRYYMVLDGTVLYNSVTYGPGQAAGNVFQCPSNGIPNFATGVAKIIDYVSPKNLRWNPDVDQLYFYCSSLGVGSLYAGKYIALVVLESRDGYRTPYNYHTLPISLSPDIPDSGDQKSYQNYQGANDTTNTGKSIELTVENIDQNYERLVVVLIRFTDKNIYDTPYIAHIEDITGSSQVLSITGAQNFGQVTIEEISSVLNIFSRVGTFTFNKNRMFAADVDINSPLLDWDPGDVGYEWFNYETPSDYIGFRNDFGTSANIWQGHLATGTSVAAATDVIKAGQWYEVTGGIARYNSVDYNGTSTSNYFQGTTSGGYVVTQWTNNGGSPVVYPVVRIQQFDGVYKYYRIQNDFLDMKGMIVSQHLVGYKRGGERYRIGIMGITKEGSIVPVTHMFDVVTPSQESFPLTTRYLDNVGSPSYEDVWNTNQLGLRIGTNAKPLDLSSIQENLSAIFIVRAPRKKRSVAQGYLDSAVINSGASGIYQPIPTLSSNFNTTYTALKQNIGMLYSPEYLFGDEDALNVTTEAKLRYSGSYSGPRPANSGNTSFGVHRGTGGGYESYMWLYHKTLTWNTSVSSKPIDSEIEVDQIRHVNIGDTGVTIGNVSGTFSRSTSFTGIDSGPDTFRGNGENGSFTLISSQTADFATHAGTLDEKPIVDIIDPANENPDYGDVSLSEYQVAGALIPINSTTFSNNGNSWSFKNIEVFGGDVYTNIFDYHKVFVDNNQPSWSLISPGNYSLDGPGFTICFPVESVINVALRSGRHAMLDGGRVQGLTNGISGFKPEDFTYYNQYDNEKAYTFGALSESADFSLVRKKSIFFSALKIPGEATNSFRRYSAANERYVELTDGNVVALRRKKDKLFCFQEEGVLFLPVEEAQLVSGDIGASTLLGVGGVIDRFSEITERYGLQDRHHLNEFDGGFLWFSITKKKLVYLTLSGEVIQMDIVKGASNLIDQYMRGKDFENYTRILNPFGQRGISSGYHERYKELYITFRHPEGNLTIGINESAMAFIGKYSMYPSHYIQYNERLFSTHQINNAQYYNYSGGLSIGFGSPTWFYKGTVVIFQESSGRAGVYEAIEDYFSTASETDLDGLSEWILLGEVTEVHDYDDPNAQVCRILGKPSQEYIEVVVNSNPEISKAFKAIRIDPGDGIYYCNEIQFNTAQHSAIKTDLDFHTTSSGEFRSTVPLRSNGARLTGKYMSVKLIHDHYSGKDTTSSGVELYKGQSDGKSLKIVSLITTFKINKKYAE
jgi:hypothetical protein